MVTPRFADLWRNYKMPETMPKSTYLRLKGAYMGYNSFDDQLEYWPEAKWGNTKHTFAIAPHICEFDCVKLDNDL